MPTKPLYNESYDDTDNYSDNIAEDNINALQSHGWRNGQACLLYVHPDGKLRHCNPINYLPYILMGSALALLIVFHIVNTIQRLYRRKLAPTPIYQYNFPLNNN